MTGPQVRQPVGLAVPGWSPRPLPDLRTLTGRTCRLVELVPAHLPQLWAAYDPTTPEHWTYLPADKPTTPEALAAAVPRREKGFFTYAVEVDGGVQGMLSLMRADPGNGVIEVGWICLGTALQRTAASTEAQRLVMGHVFDDLGYRRLEWKCDALNAPSMAAARRLGYTFEGIFRQHVVTKGRNRDTAWWAVIDRDWPQVRARLDDWLDPTNFDAEGRQLTALRVEE